MDGHENGWNAVGASLRGWFDARAAAAAGTDSDDRIDWLRALPFIGLHLACLGVIWVGVSITAVVVEKKSPRDAARNQ